MKKIINFELQEKQSLCWTSPATEILYGGSAGGGKSHAMRIVAIMLAFSVANLQIYLFRRVFSDLIKNHVEGATGFRLLLAPWISAKQIKITEEEIAFSNGSKIYLCHCQHEKDVYKYQGAEMQVILIDELTHFTEKIYKFLRGRARLGGVEIPQALKHKLPLILCGSNPGGIGHEFVRQMFIDNCEPLQLRKMANSEGGMIRQYIPAKLTDNPILVKNDPLYADKLLGLGGALAQAMLNGDWNAIEGAYFDNYEQAKHCIDYLTIPEHWTKIRAFDWGYSRPFCVLWGAVSDGSLIACGNIKRAFPKGAIIIYREFYGCTGKANEGLKINVPEIARILKQLQQNEKMDIMVADPAIFDVSHGESIANQFAKQNVGWHEADNKRVNGWQQIRARLTGNEDGLPLLYITKTCKNLLRTLPLMQYDTTKPEDLNSDLEDHAVDTLRYLCMTRPITPVELEKPKTIEEIEAERFKIDKIIKKMIDNNKKKHYHKK